jgi:hydroxymethylpyrimidine pyrophosphatase-like HAD family hydrolase
MRPITLFLDIDGTVLEQPKGYCCAHLVNRPADSLKGVVQKLNDLYNDGHVIILTTARPEPLRQQTMQQLSQTGIVYHQLVMGCSAGPRIVVNDNYCFAIKTERNSGDWTSHTLLDFSSGSFNAVPVETKGAPLWPSTSGVGGDLCDF